VGDVAGAVVAHHGLHADTAVGKPDEGAVQEGDRAGGGEVVEYLCVGEAGAVVDHHVQVLEAGHAGEAAVDPSRVLVYSQDPTMAARLAGPIKAFGAKKRS